MVHIHTAMVYSHRHGAFTPPLPSLPTGKNSTHWTVKMAEATQSRQQQLDDDGRLRRTGTVWIASAHILTALMGGVLTSPWAIAQWGWILGPILMLLFPFAAYYTSTLMAASYRSNDPDTGRRHYTYMDAVRATLSLGGCQAILCGANQYLNLGGVAIGYVIAASTSMIAIQRAYCFHSKGINGQCKVSAIPYTIAFGVVELFVSQIPDFGQTWWLSIVSAIMSFIYSTIGIALGVAKIAEAGEFSGSLTGGIGNVSIAQKIFKIFQAIGFIAEAYFFSLILLEIQDTIKSPDTIESRQPSEYRTTTMKKATFLSLSVTTIFYMLCGCFGYAAFGDLSPGNLLTGFDFSNHYWLLNIANAAIVIHHIGAYQVCCQPIFAFIEKTASEYWCLSLRTNYELNILLRLVWRSIFVIITTIISMLVPFFNDAVGVLGALGFWRLSVYLPVAMNIEHKKIHKWSRKWICLQILSMFFLIISIAAAVGSVAGLVFYVKDKLASRR